MRLKYIEWTPKFYAVECDKCGHENKVITDAAELEEQIEYGECTIEIKCYNCEHEDSIIVDLEKYPAI